MHCSLQRGFRRSMKREVPGCKANVTALERNK
jgi:hypothetical protein